MSMFLGSANKTVFMMFWVVFYTVACNTPRKYIAIDTQLKNYPAVQQYIDNPAYKPEFHDTDILLQRKSLGKKYTIMYLLSAVKNKNVIDSLTLFEVDNQINNEIIVFPRTPSPLTLLMDTYYSKDIPRVYANTTVEMLNYLYTDYAQKTWIMALDTNLCDKKWARKMLSQKIYVVKLEK